MRFLIILLTCLAAVFQYPSDLQAQCNTTPCTVPVPAINAQDACILPSQQSLNCYYGGTTPDLPQSIPSVWCTDIDNNHWFAFTATSNFVLFNFTAFGCTSGTGIQVGILSTTDCVNFQTIASCTAVLPGTPVPLITSQLVPGQVYYLCIDGIAGALCEYAINGSDPSINVVGSPNICIPTDPMVTYSTPWGASSWTINPPGAGTILGNPVGNVITVEWTQPGPAQVCAQNVACPGAPQKCMNVLVRGGVTEEHVNLCEGSTVTCAGQVYNAPGIYEVQFNNGSGCDSIVNCFVHLSPRDTSKIKVSLCGPASWTLCDTVVTTSGQYSRICTNIAGCDSVILLDLAIMLPNANITPPDTLGCGADTMITLNGSGSNLNLAAGGITRYLWTGPGIVGPDTLASVKVKLPGVYCLVLTHGRDSVFCRDTTCVTVIQETAAPQTPVLSGNPAPCAGSSEWYVATGVSTAGYEWTSTGGISFLPASQDSILVVWPDTGISGQICLLARDSCGASAPVCWSFQVSALKHPQTAQICAGNTIFLGGAFQTSPGVYIDTLTSVQGCDSILVTTLTVLSVDTVEIQQFTCDPAQAGVFTQTFSNQIGCDSVVISTITLQPTDTTQIQGLTCDPAQAGVFIQQLSNQFGCDSVVISTITLQPSDTTQIQGLTCDPAQAGVFTQQLSNQFGCDSVVISSITLQPTDTTQIQGFTCDPAQAGVFTQQLSNQFGCDSVVISTITLQPTDTTQIQGFTCDPAQAGVFTQQLSNQFGCDSLVISTITLQPSDTTQIQGFTCDPAQAGVFTQQLSNQFGCDSVVISSITLQPTDTTQIQGFTCDPAQAGVFTQQLSNQFGCDSLVISSITLQPTDTTQIQGFTCDPAQAGVFIQQLSNQFGCDSLVISTITLQPTDTTQIQGFTCDPAQAGVFTQQLSNQFGCDSVVITQRTLTLPTIAVQSISDYNGFGVSCAGNTDGSLALSITGTGSVAVEWSNGATTHALNNLGAGNYAVTVTDLNGGCTAIGSWQLEAPDTLQFSFAVNNLTCFGQENGAIQVNVQGGTEPYLFALNQQGFQPGNTFSNLDAGTYQITTMDANGCEQTEIILVNAALPVTVDLGDDLTIELGDSIELQAIVNIPLDSILSVAWTPPSNDPECMNCLEQIVAPFVSTSYAVEVTALNGCTGRDQVNILVNRSKYVFIPNVFSPNEDGENDWLSVFSRPGMVKEVKSFRVFDRWGNQLYGLEKFQPNNNQSGWDGTYKGQPMNPGVFVWVAEITFVDGITETFTGNVTLVR